MKTKEVVFFVFFCDLGRLFTSPYTKAQAQSTPAAKRAWRIRQTAATAVVLR